MTIFIGQRNLSVSCGLFSILEKSLSSLHLKHFNVKIILHLVGLRPRVYYTLTNFRGAKHPSHPPPPPSIRQ